MTEYSRMAMNRTQVTQTVLSAIEHQGPAVAEGLEELFFDGAEPARLSLAEWIAAMGAALGRTSEAMRRNDLALSVELADDAGARAARDEATVALRQALAATRALVEGAFGTAGRRALGLSGALPESAEALVAVAETTVVLSQSARLGPAPDGAQLDIPVLAQRIADAAAAVKAARERVGEETRQAQSARERRDRAAERWQRVYSGLADAFAGLALAADLGDLAERVRPTARRRAGLPEATDIPTPSE